jgi:iron(III) transport system permease protein
MNRPGAWHLRGTVAVAALLVALVAYPMIELVRTLIDIGWASVTDALSGAGTAQVIVNTLWTSVTVTLLAVVIGAAAAFATERMAVPARSLLRAAMLLPLVIPPFVSALSWDRAYGRGGLLDDITGLWVPWLVGPWGVVAVITVNAVPLAYLVTAAGWATRVEPDLERAARMSGASAWTSWWSTTLPLLRPALLSAAALVFVVAANSFGVPAILGTPAGFGTMTTRIYQDLNLSADPAAFGRVIALAVALVILTLVVIGTADTVDRRPATATGGATGPVVAPSRPARRAAAAVWLYAVVVAVVPMAALVLTALTKAVGLPMHPGNWTLANLSEALASPGPLGNSLILAIAAATIVLVLGGLTVAVGRRRAGKRLGTVAILAFAVPGSALAVAVLLAYGGWLRDTMTLILIAYLAKFWALGHRPLAGSAEAFAPSLYWAARGSGASPATAIRTVVIPVLRPAVVAAWLLVFMFAFHEITMSSLLYGPGSETLAVVILNLRQLGDVTVTAALAVLLTAVVVAGGATFAVARGVGRRRR